MDYHRVADCLDQAYPYASNSSSTSALYVSVTFFLSLPILTVRRRRRKDFSLSPSLKRENNRTFGRPFVRWRCLSLICDSYRKFINIHLPLNIIIDHPRVLNRSISTIRSDKCAERREMKDFLLRDWPEDIHLLSVRRRFDIESILPRHVILSSSSSSSSRWWWRKGANVCVQVGQPPLTHTHTHLSCGKRNILH